MCVAIWCQTLTPIDMWMVAGKVPSGKVPEIASLKDLGLQSGDTLYIVPNRQVLVTVADGQVFLAFMNR